MLPLRQRKTAGALAVVGCLAADNFVTHVALLDARTDLHHGDSVSVWHMGPPFEKSTVEAQVLGWLEDITREEQAEMTTWLKDLATRISPGLEPLRKWRHYTIHPPFESFIDKEAGRVAHWRFSCVGLVLKCYEAVVGVKLLAWDSLELPPVGQDILREAYGLNTEEYGERFRARLGIPGSGPWRIVLAGYVFHSLKRPAAEIRAIPFAPRDVSAARFR
jgi:hypothetical protein